MLFNKEKSNLLRRQEKKKNLFIFLDGAEFGYFYLSFPPFCVCSLCRVVGWMLLVDCYMASRCLVAYCSTCSILYIYMDVDIRWQLRRTGRVLSTSRNARNVKHQLGGSNTQQRGTNEKWDGRRRNDDDFFFLPFRNPPPGIRASGKKENVWWADNRSNRITERARQTRREMNCTSFHLETQKIKETKRKKKKAIANDVITTLRSS